LTRDAEYPPEPIFFVGMPRSGTTLLFGVVAAHPDLAWLSQHFRRAPRWPVVAAASRLADLSDVFRKSPQYSMERGPLREIARFGPSESYEAWERCCGRRFPRDFLLGVRATPQEREATRRLARNVVRYQGKRRFAAKITGPARLGYLKSIFPDARFVHVIRDGRSVVESLMRVGFWRDSYRMTSPAWSGGLSEEDLELWREAYGGSALALAAIEWRTVIRHARTEMAQEGLQDRYVEVRFEDFLSHPHDTLSELASSRWLADDPRPHDFLRRRVPLRGDTPRWRGELSEDDTSLLNEILGATLSDLGYGPDGAVAPRSGTLVRQLSPVS
jgi:omega-hydroxy-beta-dihydromenaquinone-9 sulfotransferase